MKVVKPLLLALGFGLSATAFSATQIQLDSSAKGAVINKNIYGQFAEHLGRGIYEGLWVGPDSKIANTKGFRNDVLAALKDLHVPLIRWPGGCFADSYDWRDGVGPRETRPRRGSGNAPVATSAAPSTRAISCANRATPEAGGFWRSALRVFKE